MEIKDLEPWGGENEQNRMVAIGWLSNTVKFNQGEVEKKTFEKLKELSKNPWQPFVSAGVHFCELCQYDAPAFSKILYIPYKGKIYVSPDAIVHYIAVHWYKPPTVFIDSVSSCPTMRSIQYYKAILSNGGRAWLKAMQRNE